MIEVERDDHVATVWLNREDKLNAMGLEFWEDLPVIMDALGADETIRSIVIAGRGRSFTVGIDLVAFAPLFTGGAASVSERREAFATIKRLQHTFTSVADCPKPVIAAVHGHCLGGGLNLVAACDIRLAAADARFSLRETKLAIVADVGALQRLPAIIDAGRLAEIAFTGRDFDAAEAAEIGLVSRVYDDPPELIAAAHEMAHAIAANSPLAVQGAKAVLRAGRDRSVEAALDYVALWNSAFGASEDIQEAVAAYVEQREPRFEGR